jgi:hypothetical protein
MSTAYTKKSAEAFGADGRWLYWLPYRCLVEFFIFFFRHATTNVFRAPQIKVTDKVMIPTEEHPDINFVGLLIGPRGNTLKCKEFVQMICVLHVFLIQINLVKTTLDC